MTLLEYVLGKELADACLDEILKRSRPTDSEYLTKILREEIIGRYVQKAEITIDKLRDIVFAEGSPFKDADFAEELRRELNEIEEIHKSMINRFLVRGMVNDLTPDSEEQLNENSIP